jgi:nicotinate-nucleotide pyrophosphorylase (carboxylating)
MQAPSFTGIADLSRTVRQDVECALGEDLGSGDLTTALVPADRRCVATVFCREPAVLCGLPWFAQTVYQCDAQARVEFLHPEGAVCESGQPVLRVHGRARAVLSAERTALNFLQLLSAVATSTARYVRAVRPLPVQVVDTRKTLPGLRFAQKYAVRVGGGQNHRMGLFDAILVKENHIAAAGGIAQVMEGLAEQALAPGASPPRFVQIEVETLDQLQEALQAGASMVLLDNMALPDIRRAVEINAACGDRRALLEASGGVTLESVAALAQTGVDRISVGALTKDIRAVDFSMRFATE